MTTSNRRAARVAESIAEAYGVPIVEATEVDQEQPESRLIPDPDTIDTVPELPGAFQVMPPPTLEEYRALVESIAANGVQVPILVDEVGHVVDGHYRKHIAKQLGIHCPTQVMPGLTDAEKFAMALTLNVDRRHLSVAQRRELLATSIKAEPGASDREHARRTGTSPTTAGNVRSDLEKSGDVSRLDTHKDSTGREQPASKGRESKPEPEPSKAPPVPRLSIVADSPAVLAPYVPEPIGCVSDAGLPIADHKRIRSALNLTRYDAHASADKLREQGEQALNDECANWIDDTIEWLSVVRDGLRGMAFHERYEASIARWDARRRG